MKKHSKKWYRHQCDRLFSEIVRMKGRCEETNVTEDLQCAHIISRSYHSTRWSFDNAVCLSRKRHMYYTNRPVEWEKFVISKIGEDRYEDLKRRALDYSAARAIDYDDLYQSLKAIHADRLARRNR